MAKIRRQSAPPKPAAAFTLVEMLIVVGILVLLITIAVPGIMQARIVTRMNATRSTINMLAGACEAFRADAAETLILRGSQAWEYYPPSKLAAADAGPWLEDPQDYVKVEGFKGRHLLTQWLIGHMKDRNEGYGWRTNGGKKVYGPYNGTEKLETITEDVVKKSFVDGFGEPILYYRWTGSRFDPAENNDKYGAPADSDFPTNRNPFGNGFPFAGNILLISAGPDKVFGKNSETGKNDDISNLDSERPQ